MNILYRAIENTNQRYINTKMVLSIMTEKQIHIRISEEMYQELMNYMKMNGITIPSRAIVQLLSQALHKESLSPVMVSEIPSTDIIETMSPEQKQILKQLEMCQEQIKIKDQQIMGLVAAQAQASKNAKQIVRFFTKML